MVKSGFHIGNRDWWVMLYFGIKGEDDLSEVYEALLFSGCPDYKAQRACMTLSQPNKGYTFTDYNERFTLMFVSRTTSVDEMFDSILHEIKHIVEHVSTYYDLNPKEELAAYLQGEVGRQIWPAAARGLCPKCNCYRKIF